MQLHREMPLLFVESNLNATGTGADSGAVCSERREIRKALSRYVVRANEEGWPDQRIVPNYMSSRLELKTVLCCRRMINASLVAHRILHWLRRWYFLLGFAVDEEVTLVVFATLDLGTMFLRYRRQQSCTPNSRHPSPHLHPLTILLCTSNGSFYTLC